MYQMFCNNDISEIKNHRGLKIVTIYKKNYDIIYRFAYC